MNHYVGAQNTGPQCSRQTYPDQPQQQHILSSSFARSSWRAMALPSTDEMAELQRLSEKYQPELEVSLHCHCLMPTDMARVHLSATNFP